MQAFINALKFVVTLFLLPIVLAATLAFWKVIAPLEHDYQQQLSLGAITFVVLQLFVLNFIGIYDFFHHIFASAFKFSSFVGNVVLFAFPLLPGILLIILYIMDSALVVPVDKSMFLFFVGFSAALHLVLTAHFLRETDTNVMKVNYLFAMSLYFISNLLFLVFLLGINFSDIKVGEFVALTREATKEHYVWGFKKIFLPAAQ